MKSNNCLLKIQDTEKTIMWQREGERLEASQRWSSAVCAAALITRNDQMQVGFCKKGSDTWGGGLHCQHCSSYRCHCGDLWASQLHQRRAQHILKGLKAITCKKRQAVTLKAVTDTNAITTFGFMNINKTFAAPVTWCLVRLIILMAAAPGRSSPAGVWQLPNVIQVPPADPAHSCSQMLLKTHCCNMKGSIKINPNKINHIPVIHVVGCMQY